MSSSPSSASSLSTTTTTTITKHSFTVDQLLKIQVDEKPLKPAPKKVKTDSTTVPAMNFCGSFPTIKREDNKDEIDDSRRRNSSSDELKQQKKLISDFIGCRTSHMDNGNKKFAYVYSFLTPEVFQEFNNQCQYFHILQCLLPFGRRYRTIFRTFEILPFGRY